MNKKDLSECDICSKFIGPALKRADWDGMMQILEEVAFTKGRIIVRGKLVTRGKAKRADYQTGRKAPALQAGDIRLAFLANSPHPKTKGLGLDWI